MPGVDDVTVTVAEAARFFGVAPTTVWTWINRAGLQPVGIRKRGAGKGQSPYEYRFGDLAGLEMKARNAPVSGRPRKRRCP